MRATVISRSYAAEQTTNIAYTQSVSSTTGSLLINGTAASGGIATISAAGAIFFTFTNTASSINFNITGKSNSNQTLTETIVPLTASSALSASSVYGNWSQISAITYTSSTGVYSGTVSVGTRQGGDTGWIPMDIYTANNNIAVSVTVAGTVNYTVFYTNEDPFDIVTYNSGTPQQSVVADAIFSAASTSQTCTLSSATRPNTLVRALKLTINSGSGSARMTITQQSTQ